MNDIEAIKQPKARYFRLMDTKDWAGMRTLFAPDVIVDVSGDGAGVFHGVDEFFTMLEAALNGVISVHHGHMPEIQITSPTTASGIWAMEDHLWWPGGSGPKQLHGYGHYHETYAKVGGDWLIKTTRLTRLRVDMS